MDSAHLEQRGDLFHSGSGAKQTDRSLGLLPRGPSESPAEVLCEESGDREGGPLPAPSFGVLSEGWGWGGFCLNNCPLPSDTTLYLLFCPGHQLFFIEWIASSWRPP